eukprot:s5076_g3.t1
MHAYRSNEDPSARNKDEAEDGKRKACAVSDSEDQEMTKEGRGKEEAKESKLVREKDRPRHAKPKKMPMNLLKESKPKAWCSVTAKWLKKEEAKQARRTENEEAKKENPRRGKAEENGAGEEEKEKIIKAVRKSRRQLVRKKEWDLGHSTLSAIHYFTVGDNGSRLWQIFDSVMDLTLRGPDGKLRLALHL